MASATVRIAATAAALLLAAPAIAEDVPTVAEHLCTFAGQCGGSAVSAGGAQKDAGETRGFRLARANVPAAATKPALSQPARRTANAVALTRAAEAVGTGARGGLNQRRGDLRIGFALNSAEMTPVGIDAARAFAQAIQNPVLAGARFAIEGHTDSLGTVDANRDLSQRRAQAVADYLVGQGVARDRLEVQGFGSSQPITGTGAGNPANRRVEALRLK